MVGQSSESWRGVCSAVRTTYFIGPVIGAIAAGALLWEFDDASRDKSLTGQAKKLTLISWGC